MTIEINCNALKSIIDPPTNNNNKELNIIFFLSNICLKENNV